MGKPIRTNILSSLPTDLEARRQQALCVAENCIRLLQDKFGATEVIICGSLAGESPWHWHSDIDLATKGISKERVWEALLVIEDIVPYWLKVDVIPLEFAPSYLVDRILQKTPMPKNKYLALKIRIEDELISLKDTIQKIAELLQQQDAIPEVALIPALASYVADFYSGSERIGERVAVYLDGGLPKKEDWHLELLKQLAEPGIDNSRPPLCRGALLLELDEYRKFRYLERHIYKIELKPELVIVLAQNVESVFERMQSAISDFIQWLKQQAE